MVQKIKRFIVFAFFSLLFALIGGKASKAGSTKNVACVTPAQGGKAYYDMKALDGITSIDITDGDDCY